MEFDALQNMGRLSDRIYHILRREIVSGKLAPGQHLALEEIAQNLGVSTTPVRDAFSLLAADGFIEWRPRRGAFVAHLTPKVVQEIYQVREFLECASVDYAVEKAAEVSGEMQALTGQMATVSRLGARPDASRYAELELCFHGLPVESVGNSKLTEIYCGLRSTMTIAFTLYPMVPTRVRDTAAEHQAIVDTIRRGDAEAARAAIRVHIRQGAADLIRLLETSEAEE